MKNEPVSVGVVGLGTIAHSHHLPVLTRLKDVKIVAVCDSNVEIAEKTAYQYKVPNYYSDFNEMLKNESLEVVDILTPSDTHVDLAIQAMKSGCHCVMEKPLATNIKDADRLVQISNETGKALHITHNYSFFPSIRKATSILQSGLIGKVVNVHIKYITSLKEERYSNPSHWCHRLPGGIFADISPHLVMILLDFLGCNINVTSATAKKISTAIDIKADELIVIVESTESLGTLNLSFNSPIRQFTIDIVGTKMSLSVNVYAQTVVLHKAVSQDTTIGSFMSGIPRGLRIADEIFQQITALSSMTMGVISGKHDYLEAHRYLLEASIHNVRGKGIYPIDVVKCREVVRLSEVIWQSI